MKGNDNYTLKEALPHLEEAVRRGMTQKQAIAYAQEQLRPQESGWGKTLLWVVGIIGIVSILVSTPFLCNLYQSRVVAPTPPPMATAQIAGSEGVDIRFTSPPAGQSLRVGEWATIGLRITQRGSDEPAGDGATVTFSADPANMGRFETRDEISTEQGVANARYQPERSGEVKIIVVVSYDSREFPESIQLTIEPEQKPDLSVTIESPAEAPLTAGNPFTVHLTVANNGSDKAGDVKIRAEIPEGVTIVGRDDGCDDEAVEQESERVVIVCNVGEVPVNGQAKKGLQLLADTDQQVTISNVTVSASNSEEKQASPFSFHITKPPPEDLRLDVYPRRAILTSSITSSITLTATVLGQNREPLVGISYPVSFSAPPDVGYFSATAMDSDTSTGQAVVTFTPAVTESQTITFTATTADTGPEAAAPVTLTRPGWVQGGTETPGRSLYFRVDRMLDRHMIVYRLPVNTLIECLGEQVEGVDGHIFKKVIVRLWVPGNDIQENERYYLDADATYWPVYTGEEDIRLQTDPERVGRLEEGHIVITTGDEVDVVVLDKEGWVHYWLIEVEGWLAEAAISYEPPGQ